MNSLVFCRLCLLRGGLARGSQQGRLLLLAPGGVALSCEALVLTPAEYADLLAGGSAMAQALQIDCRRRWRWGAPP
jgi:hypothetical protein